LVFVVNLRHVLRNMGFGAADCNFMRRRGGHGCAHDLRHAHRLVLFAFASSITPGPNNVMLLASGANFGLRRTVPHMLGISGGHAFMVALVGLGLLGLFAAVPWLRTGADGGQRGLPVCGWHGRSPTPPRPRAAEAKGRPLTFLQAAAFQWVNPKAWYMAIYAQTNFAPGDGAWGGAVLVALVFAAVNLPSVTVWAWGGTQISRWLRGPGRLSAFNITMALLLVASLWPLVEPILRPAG
jgi:threonine/homoserine/homoserine lactone efflux protein